MITFALIVLTLLTIIFTTYWLNMSLGDMPGREFFARIGCDKFFFTAVFLLLCIFIQFLFMLIADRMGIAV